MSISGSFALSINDAEIDFVELSNILMKPTSVVRKGQVITRKKKAPYDIWIYEVEFSDQITPCNALEKLLNEMECFQEGLRTIQSKYDVTLSCYLRSVYGQMGFDLSPNVIQLLAKLHLGLELHILSFGGVE